MTRMQLRWAAALGAVMALQAAAHGEDPWWVVKPRPQTGRPAAATPVRPAAAPPASLGRPTAAASLGRPFAVPAPAAPPAADAGWDAPTTAGPPPASGWDAPTAAFVPPPARVVTPAGYDPEPGGFLPPRVARAQPPDPPAPGALGGPPPVPPGGDGNYNAGVAVDQPLHHGFFDGCREWFNFGASHPSTTDGGWFKSDCFCEDGMISPVSNPFFFEDPRALTEIEPLFIFQTARKSAGGGNSEFFGLQGRLALSDRFSLVLNKLGFVSLNPSDPVDGYQKGTGFAEVFLGPKFTFWRDESLRNAAAVGLTLELPVGSAKVFQDTGTLGLDPYVSYGQTFGDSSFGSFDFIGEAGYSFSVDDRRAQFFHGSLHLDYDIARLHRFYPLLEMNYFYYARRGDRTDLNFEGGDLVNFGARGLTGRSLLTIAPGFRYKFNEWANVGTAVEFPLTGGSHGIESFRWTVDLIFRY